MVRRCKSLSACFSFELGDDLLWAFKPSPVVKDPFTVNAHTQLSTPYLQCSTICMLLKGQSDEK